METSIKSKVLVLLDWDNLFLCLHDKFGAEMDLEQRMQKLMEWIQSEIGEIFEGWGFVFAPDHLSILHRDICTRCRLRLMVCPKRQTGDMQEDTVDEILMWFGRAMLKHPDIGFVCLISGDADYIPFMEEATRFGVKRTIATPTINALARNLLECADINPKTGRKMVLRLDTLDIAVRHIVRE